MKTPVDPVVRIQKRLVDDLKRQIADHDGQRSHLVAQEQRINGEIEDQYRAAAMEWALDVHAFARRKITERARFSRERREVEAVLDDLRRRAVDAYGRLRAAERVAEEYREEDRLAEARGEQAKADDFVVGRFRAHLRRNEERRRLSQGDDQWA